MRKRGLAELEKQHARILKQDPTTLFDQEAIRRNVREGDMVFNNTDPVLLAIVSKSGLTPNEQREPQACGVCRGAREAMQFAWGVGKGTGAWTMFELVSVAHKLSKELARTEPRHRGRS